MISWDVFDMIGTIAFAISGAIIAMEEEYDLLGVIVLGMVTAFGGGVVRNLLIGLPASNIWEQGTLLKTALTALCIVFLMPVDWIKRSMRLLILFDAIGLSAFSIQGAEFAESMHHPTSAVIVAAMLTGIGGGIIRDVFAGRKPLVLHNEIYAAWSILSGFVIAMQWIKIQSPFQMYLLFIVIVFLRMLSVRYNWRLPKRTM